MYWKKEVGVEGEAAVMVEEIPQLKKLASIELNQQEVLAGSIGSEDRRVEFLKDCKSAYNDAVGLLEKTESLVSKYEGDETRAPIAEGIAEFVKCGVSISMSMSVGDASLRESSIDMLKAHYDYLAAELQSVDPEDALDVSRVAEITSTYKLGMLEGFCPENRMQLRGDNGNMFVLEDIGQLTKLAKLLLDREELLAEAMELGADEQTKRLKDYRESYDLVVSLLDTAQGLSDKYKVDENNQAKSADIAQGILEFAMYGVNISLQRFGDLNCADKVKTHFDYLVHELENMDPEDADDVERVAKEVNVYNRDIRTFPDPIGRQTNELAFEDGHEAFGGAQLLTTADQIQGSISSTPTTMDPRSVHGWDVSMLMRSDQLKTLARVLLNQEVRLMERIRSEDDRARYLMACNDAYTGIVTLVDDADALTSKYQGGASSDKAAIARDLAEYVKGGANTCMQNIRNCTMRVDGIAKIRALFDELVDELDAPSAAKDILDLAEEVATYKEYMMEYTTNMRSASGRAKSRAFAQWLMLEGITYEDLLKRHALKLGFKDDFENLKDWEKLEVYDDIIEQSGRSSGSKRGKKIKKAKAVASFLFDAGVMVYDIYTAEHRLEEVLRIALTALLDYGAFKVQVAVQAAVTTALVKLGVGVLVVSAAGLVVGAVVGLLFTAATGALVDWIFGRGVVSPEALEDLKFHTATMPDGMALAYQIAHQG